MQRWLTRLFRWRDHVQPAHQNGYRPLELVPTDELVDELAQRYNTCAFIGQTPTAEDDLREACYFYGQERIMQGLAMSLVIKCQNNITQRMHKDNY